MDTNELPVQIDCPIENLPDFYPALDIRVGSMIGYKFWSGFTGDGPFYYVYKIIGTKYIHHTLTGENIKLFIVYCGGVNRLQLLYPKTMQFLTYPMWENSIEKWEIITHSQLKDDKKYFFQGYFYNKDGTQGNMKPEDIK